MPTSKPAHLHLVTAQRSAPPRLSMDAEASARAALSESTRRRYTTAWGAFSAWCEREGQDALPAAPEVVSNYLASIRVRGLAASSLRVALAAINHHHVEDGRAAPGNSSVVKTVLAGDHRLIRRARRVRRKKGLLPGDLRAVVDRLDLDSLKALRDRALLLVGFAAALRRAELVALTVDDIEMHEGRGLRIHIRDAKTAVGDEAQFVDVQPARDPELCPIRALQEWLAVAEIEAGPVFRRVGKGGQLGDQALSGRSVSRIVKEHAARVGLGGDFAGHSLRAGFVTSALERGVPITSIRHVTRHASLQMLAVYDRRAFHRVDAGL